MRVHLAVARILLRQVINRIDLFFLSLSSMSVEGRTFPQFSVFLDWRRMMCDLEKLFVSRKACVALRAFRFHQPFGTMVERKAKGNERSGSTETLSPVFVPRRRL